MPTYDYVCDGCGHAFELFQSMTDAVKKTCPKCGKKKLRRLIGAGGAIMFKGSGFHRPDRCIRDQPGCRFDHGQRQRAHLRPVGGHGD